MHFFFFFFLEETADHVVVVFRRGRIVASLRKEETDGNDIVSYITGVKGGSDAAYA